MKKLLIPTLLVMLAACSGEKSNEQNTGRVKHAYISPDAPTYEITAAGMEPCLKDLKAKQPCATVLLKKGAAVPKYPLAKLGDVLMVYIYNPASIPGVGFDYRYNCNIIKNQTELCMGYADEANQLLEPFLQ